MGRRIDGAEEGEEPLGERAAGDGDEGHHDADEDGEKDKGPFDDEGEGKTVNDKTDGDAGGKLEKLLESHVADKTEFVGGYVLRYWVLFHVFMLLREVDCARELDFHKSLIEAKQFVLLKLFRMVWVYQDLRLS